MNKTQTLVKEINELRAKGANVMFTAKKDEKGDYILSSSQFEEIRARQDEVNAKSIELEESRADDLKQAQDDAAEAKSRIDAMEKALVSNPLGGGQSKSVAEIISEGLSGMSSGRVSLQLDAGQMSSLHSGEVKTTMTRAAGYAPAVIRDGSVIAPITRPIQLLDLVPFGDPNDMTNAYMTTSTFTNNAVETAEGSAAGEAALAYTEVQDYIADIPVVLPVTRQQMRDVAAVRNIVETQLLFMVRQRLDGQMAVGNGTAPNLRGLYNATGVQTQARGADTTLDAILKAVGLVSGSGGTFWGSPNFVAMQTADLISLALVKDSTGRYLMGDPAAGLISRCWGLNIVAADAMTLDTGLVGDTNYCLWKPKGTIDVEWTNSHASNFASSIDMLRVIVSGAFRITRGQAFCQITNLI